MTPDTLTAWRSRLGLNRSEAAVALGLSRNGYTRYETGKAPIPLYIALACAALEWGIPQIEENHMDDPIDDRVKELLKQLSDLGHEFQARIKPIMDELENLKWLNKTDSTKSH